MGKGASDAVPKCQVTYAITVTSVPTKNIFPTLLNQNVQEAVCLADSPDDLVKRIGWKPMEWKELWLELENLAGKVNLRDTGKIKFN